LDLLADPSLPWIMRKKPPVVCMNLVEVVGLLSVSSYVIGRKPNLGA